MNSIMAYLKLGQNVAIKRESKQTLAHMLAKSVGMCRSGSLFIINPSGRNTAVGTTKLSAVSCRTDYTTAR